MQTWLKIILAVGVLAFSFWITLLATEPPPLADLDVAAALEGLSRSDGVAGAVDSIKRDPAGRLQLTGWAFDKELAQPVSVRVLIGGKFEQVAVTNGPRSDVTQALNETAERTKNIAFAGLTEKPVVCGPFTIVGVNQKKHVSILASDLMVPRCTS